MIRLCDLHDIPEQAGIGIQTTAGEVVLLQRDGQVYAYRNHCPHLGIDLNFQSDVFMDLDGVFIQCANHGALFQVEDGLCIHGPCQGQSLTAVPVQIIDNAVWMSPLISD
jgi:nitrite reductase/ring-hydroxylating ferredoxin subunit